MISGVYQIRQLMSGKLYVGSSVDITRRQKEHTRALNGGRHRNVKLQSAWDKYGRDSFEFATLVICRREDLLMYEQLAIDALNPTYNCCPVAGNTLGTRRTHEQRSRLSSLKKLAIPKGSNAAMRAAAAARAALAEKRKDPEFRKAHRKKILEAWAKREPRLYCHDGCCMRASEWAEKLGISETAVYRRLRAHGESALGLGVRSQMRKAA